MSWGYWARGVAENDIRKNSLLMWHNVFVLAGGLLMWHMYWLWQEAPPDTDVVVEWRGQLSSRVECRVGATCLILILIDSNISS